MIPRLALIGTCVVALGGLVAAPAEAASPVTIGTPTAITPESAMVGGTIATSGQTGTYVFSYDTVADAASGGNNTSYTFPQDFPAGGGTIAVSTELGCYPALTCTVDQTPLSPDSKYVVQLLVSFGTGGEYYDVAPAASPFGYFTTQPLGSVKWSGPTKLKAKKGKTSFGLKCASLQRCTGLYKLTTRSHGKSVVCASGRFILAAGAKSNVSVKLSGKCLKLLAKSKSLSISGEVVASPLTDQHATKAAVKLELTPATKKHKK